MSTAISELREVTTIFIDFETCMFDTDTLVLTTVYKMIHDGLKLPFVDFNNSREFQPFLEILPKFKFVKRYKNPLYEFLQTDNESNRNLCDQLYNEIIYRDHDILFMINNIQRSNFINSIRPFISTKNFKMLFIYMNKYIPSIDDYIRTILSFDRYTIVVGNKKDFIGTQKCDSYVFQDIHDYTFITNHNQFDIISPDFTFNKKIVESDELRNWEKNHSASINLISTYKML